METLAVEGGKELVKALATGLVELVKSVPSLWRRSGRDAEERIAVELGRSAAELAAAGEDGAARAYVRAEAVWESRLRDLLAAHPEAQHDLEQILAEIRQASPPVPSIQQNVAAIGQGSTAQGVLGGSIHNHGGTTRGNADADDGKAEGQR